MTSLVDLYMYILKTKTDKRKWYGEKKGGRGRRLLTSVGILMSIDIYWYATIS